jgi:hypothetical protein
MASGIDICCSSIGGPCFRGSKNAELAPKKEPFNGKHMWFSEWNQPGYKISVLDGKNRLTNEFGIDFTISELEVWLVEEE